MEMLFVTEVFVVDDAVKYLNEVVGWFVKADEVRVIVDASCSWCALVIRGMG